MGGGNLFFVLLLWLNPAAFRSPDFKPPCICGLTNLDNLRRQFLGFGLIHRNPQPRRIGQHDIAIDDGERLRHHGRVERNFILPGHRPGDILPKPDVFARAFPANHPRQLLERGVADANKIFDP